MAAARSKKSKVVSYTKWDKPMTDYATYHVANPNTGTYYLIILQEL